MQGQKFVKIFCCYYWKWILYQNFSSFSRVAVLRAESIDSFHVFLHLWMMQQEPKHLPTSTDYFGPQGSHLSAPNQDGRTALHVACHSGDLRLVQFLLNNGASVHVRDYRGDSPLIDAIHAKNLDIIYLLVQTGAVIPWSKSAIALHLCR